MDIKRNVKRIATLRGTTFTKLSAKFGISRMAMYKRLTNNPTLKTLEEIAGALEVPVSVILEENPRLAGLAPEKPKKKEPKFVICPKCGLKIPLTPEESQETEEEE